MRVHALSRSLALLSGFSTNGGFACHRSTYTLHRSIPSERGPFTPSSPHRNVRRCRNVDLLSISFAFRLHLRTRLTLIRLTLIRNPWSIGGQVFHLPNRYLCLHFLFRTLQHTSRYAFSADRNAPLPILTDPTASVVCLMPDHYPCRTARLVSCYALFKWMAASKPTS